MVSEFTRRQHLAEITVNGSARLLGDHSSTSVVGNASRGVIALSIPEVTCSHGGYYACAATYFTGPSKSPSEVSRMCAMDNDGNLAYNILSEETTAQVKVKGAGRKRVFYNYHVSSLSKRIISSLPRSY